MQPNNQCEATLCLMKIINHFQSFSHWKIRAIVDPDIFQDEEAIRKELEQKIFKIEQAAIQNFQQYIQTWVWVNASYNFLNYITMLNNTSFGGKYDFCDMLTKISYYLTDNEIQSAVIAYGSLIK
jgi:hypothetical protein